MLSIEENRLLTHVGPGTPMGALMRRYWIPACLSEEMPEPDGTPVRVRLLGEDLVAFRDSQGRIGLLDELCSHRCASLAYGRNEQSGLRCLYHGWKYDVEGRCVDMPNEPPPLAGPPVGADTQAPATPTAAAPGRTFKDRIVHVAYPTREAGGVVWAYMGPSNKLPPFPEWEFIQASPEQRDVSKVLEDCSYAQGVEGSIDSAHSDYLHSSDIRGRPRDHSPRLEALDTLYGFRYAAIRKPNEDADKLKYVRVTVFILPCYVLIPPQRRGNDEVVVLHAFVPIDDEHNFFYSLRFNRTGTLRDSHREQFRLDGRYRPARNRANMHLQDRAAMKAGNWTGIEGVNSQDMAMVESMGPIARRHREHLGTSDVAVIRMRRRLIDAARGLQEGFEPPGLDPSIRYDLLHSEEQFVPIDVPWQEVGAYEGEFGKAVESGARSS